MYVSEVSAGVMVLCEVSGSTPKISSMLKPFSCHPNIDADISLHDIPETAEMLWNM